MKSFVQEISNLAENNEIKTFLEQVTNKKNPKLEDAFKIKVDGGGRITHCSGNNSSINVYGYSQAYGQADHFLTAQILKGAYKNYVEDKITYSNEGY